MKWKLVALQCLLPSPFSLLGRGFSKFVSSQIQTRFTTAAAVNWMWGASANELFRIQSKMVKHRSNSFSSSREQFVRVFTLLLITTFHNCVLRANELNKNNGIMFPNRQQQIVNSGDNVTITCIFIHSAEIKWIYPEYLFKTPQVSQQPPRFSWLHHLKKVEILELTDQHERQTFELYVRKERNSRFVDNDPVKSPGERHGLLRVLPAPVWRTASQTISLRLQ